MDQPNPLAWLITLTPSMLNTIYLFGLPNSLLQTGMQRLVPNGLLLMFQTSWHKSYLPLSLENMLRNIVGKLDQQVISIWEQVPYLTMMDLWLNWDYNTKNFNPWKNNFMSFILWKFKKHFYLLKINNNIFFLIFNIFEYI